MRKFLSFFAAILFAGSMMATDYKLVTSASDLVAGAKYIIGSADATGGVFMGTKTNTNNRVQTPTITITDGKITLTDTVLVLELGGETGAWTFKTLNYHGTNGYLANASSGTTNALYVQSSSMAFTITFNGNKALINSTGGNERKLMRYNSGSKCFACYTSSQQKDVYLYKEVAAPATAKYYIAGTMTNWAANMVEMTAGNDDSLSVKIALEADSLYEFKVVKVLGTDTTWFGNAEAATMTYGNSTGWWLTGSKNVGLQTTKADKYEFIFKANANNEISVVIPAPAPAPVVYYAKYKDDKDAWNWHALTEKEGKWLTDTIVYYGGGMNIHSAQEGDGKYFGEIAGVATNDTAYFTFNPADSTLAATVTGKYIAPVVPTAKYYIAGTMTDWATNMVEMTAGNDDTLSVKIALEADSLYAFKVVKILDTDTTWFGNAEAATMTYGNSTGWWLKGNVNVGLQTTKAADYEFIFKANANNEISVVIPEPAPVIPAKYYITGDSALVTDAGAPGKAWQADAIKSEKDTFVLKLKAGQKYFLKVVEDGNWEGGKVYGYSRLTEITSAGVGHDADDNIVFSMAKDGEVQVIYFWEGEVLTFKVVSDDFYFKPIIMADMKIVPNQWADGNAKIAAWVWDKDGEMENYFTPFLEPVAEGNDTLITKINAEADSIIFVRFNATATEPKWNGGEGYQWNQTPNTLINWESGVFTILPGTEYVTNGTWEAYIPVVPAKYYITGDSALVTDAGFAGKAWNPAAIKADQDTMVLNLKADQYYILKVTVNGTWEGENNVKGYNELTEKTPGLDDEGKDHNIGFKLNTAGAVKVIYNDSVFKLAGDFYVAPVPVTPKYYVAGNMNGWDASKNPAYQDTLVLSLTAGDYQMKVVDNNNWIGVEALTDTAMNLYNVEGNVAFTLAADGDVKVIYKSGELFKVEGAFVAPAIKLAGIKGWEAADHIALTPDADGKTAEVAVALDQWYYEFKLVLGANWLSRNGSGAGEDSLYTIKSDRNYVEGMKNNQDNLCLRPNVVPGNYTFTYDLMAGKLTVTFPEPIPADPTAAVKGSMNNWGDSIPFVLAQDKKSASLTANIKKGNYEFKMIINGEWRSNGYTYHRDFPGCAGITANVEANMVLQLDVDGDYTFTWTFENDSLGIVFPNKPIPVLENGYYLVGDKYDWTPAATRMFVENTSAAGEYILADITLAADDSLKVVKVEDDEIITWYPAGDNYIVDANHAGVKTIYFRPDGQGGEGWFAGTIYIEANSGEGVENTNANTKATKSLNKGVLIIEKNGVRYNSLGQVIR